MPRFIRNYKPDDNEDDNWLDFRHPVNWHLRLVFISQRFSSWSGTRAPEARGVPGGGRA